MENVATIELSENYRYAAWYDAYGFDYLKEWDHDGWGVFTMRKSRDHVEMSLDSLDINERLSTILDYHGYDTAAAEVAKALTRAGYQHRFISMGYSPWIEIVVYWDPTQIADISGIPEELRAWYDGEVYTVALERKDTYHGPNGKTIETWEVVESVGCVIFTDSYEFNLENCRDLLGYAEKAAA